MTMSEGDPHPSALKKTIEFRERPTGYGVSLSISHHRLAYMVKSPVSIALELYVWDWRTGELLFVREMPT